MRRRLIRVAICVISVVAVLIVLALAVAPYAFAELAARLEHHAIIPPAGVELAAGHMVDDYWAVQDINARRICITTTPAALRPSRRSR